MRLLKQLAAGALHGGIFVVFPCFFAGSPASSLEAQVVEGEVVRSEAADLEQREKEFRAALDRMNKASTAPVILSETERLAEAFPESRAVLVEATRKGSERQRRFAVKILGDEGSTEEDLPVVLSALGDRSNRVRLAAVMATRKLGPDGGALAELLRYLLVEDDANNLKMAVSTFKDWRIEESVPHLVDLLQKSDDRGVRNFCVSALRTITGKQYSDNVETWRAYVDAQEALRNELLDRRGPRRKKEI